MRPVELSEIDKQGHKMLVVFPLVFEQARRLPPAGARNLFTRVIEGALFEYLFRLVTTDIKPPLFYKIKENPEHYEKLTEYILQTLEPTLEPLGSFWDRMRLWHRDWQNTGDPARKILMAAHLYASQWEFKLIRPLNSFDEEMDYISGAFDDDLAAFEDLPGFKDICSSATALGKFANLCGQLRFQTRWTQVPRLPATSVLGHSFITAVCAYLFSLSLGASQTRANNNFFTGLFHDFPELLTRDIISPVKSSIPVLSKIIKEYEEEELNRRILTPFRNDGLNPLADRISYFLGLQTGSEFMESCIVNGRVCALRGYKELNEMDADELDPKDGLLIKICDLLSAFLETHTSIATGVSSAHLREAGLRLKTSLIDKAKAAPGLNIKALLADFD